jgi:hypothetical protein
MRQAITATKPATEVINDIAGKPMIDNPAPQPKNEKLVPSLSILPAVKISGGPAQCRFHRTKASVGERESRRGKASLARKQAGAADAAQGNMPVDGLRAR